MALQTTQTSGLAVQYQKYFIKLLLKHAIQALSLADYAKKAKLPANTGATTVRFFRKNVADATKVLALTEGVPPTQYREIAFTPIDVPLAQYGEVAKITDVLSWTQLFDTLKETIATMGEDCALQADTLTRNTIVSGVTTAGQLRYAQGLASFAALCAASQTAGRFVVNDLLDGMTRLQVNRAALIDGSYVGIVPPQVARDLMDDDKWVKAAQYSDVKKLYKGEVGMIYGVRIVVATNPFIENGANTGSQGTYDNTGTSANSIFTSIILGADAYGIVDMAGQSPMSPKMIIVDRADKSDPLNQTITAGWKAYWASVLLDQTYAVTIRSKSAFA